LKNSLISQRSVNKSQMLTKDLHAKLNENKIPHYELLLYKGKEIEKKREQIQREKQEEIEKQERQFSNQRKNAQNSSKIKTQRKDASGEIQLSNKIFIDEEANNLDNMMTVESRDEIGIIDNSKEYLSITSPRFTESDVVSPQKSTTPKFPILFVDINLGSNKIERITIYEGNLRFKFV